MDTQPPLEDINAIVSRFQAWAGAQAPTQGKHGVRELTYEEAIRSSRRRTAPEKAAMADEPAAPAKARHQPVHERSTAKPAKSKKRASSRHVKSRTCKNKAVPAGKTPSVIKSQDLVVQPPAVFRQVLAAQVAPVPALAVECRTTALSLRVSAGEHSLLKARATEANLSVSAYLRSCLFEVEDLRAQLRQLRLAQQPVAMHTLALPGVFTSCARFVQRLFRGKTTTLAVRA
jgi:hypothetical protein